MIKFFQNHFALSETGAKDLRTAIFWRTLLNLSMMLPVVLTFTFLQDYLGLLKSETLPSYGILFYLIFALCAFLVMYSLAYIDYEKCYTKIYNESAGRRIKLAETLRQLPMAFFGKKDTADLSSLIMEDATQIEMLFSHAVPQIFAAAISMSVMGLSMFLYDWRMSLAMFWVVPVGFLVFYLSKQKMQRNHDVIYAQRLLISEQIQNGMDMVQEIKSYNQETHYLDTLNQTLDEYEKKLINLELLGGALLNISYSMLKLGLPSVIIIGAWLFSQDAISLFTYLVFLILVGRIYDPFIDVMNHFALLLYLDVRIKRMKEMDAMPRQTGNKTFNPTHFDIEFKAVNFSYQTGMKTLQDVSFVAK
ncbi:ABC transporter transmembrane domain-containing protein [Pasteurella atlantica]|uniref:ABC transporter transmembrane domain-containing protein n=1 Tax=Pasteurellaceae TaxID=712 RepID=UPI0027572F4C|nr:ABC transporter ATP-binding protein [Pasteurella atlantica]MDP8098391.1 ABC transporter ATP-binding protein [Pasteurella atlantica]MDP8106495.1 ABC transporter ATP-binding protein [Pasteurella atlantica]MDP8116194.1 ABC transporter ATP-binding protein [Pasteurella atlantica]